MLSPPVPDGEGRPAPEGFALRHGLNRLGRLAIAASAFCFFLGASASVAARNSGPDSAGWIVDTAHGPERDVDIDVEEGTWLSLDVSPDGREILFDLLGDLYVVPVEGGEARALTQGRVWDVQPRFSPDGRWISSRATAVAVTISG